mgnify:CR=1 FL=1
MIFDDDITLVNIMPQIQFGLCCMNTALIMQKPSVFASRTILIK